MKGERPKWSNGENSTVVRHKGYGWGRLYKNIGRSNYCLVKSSGRKYLVRSLTEIVHWNEEVSERFQSNGRMLYDMNMRMTRKEADGQV